MSNSTDTQTQATPWKDPGGEAQKPVIINNQAERKFRPEIQGLRALAVLLVAAYHFWFGKVSGGVDVFLLISAFLMAGSFTRRIEKGQFRWLKSVVDYWVHVFKRILPLAAVTVLGILVGSYLLLPQDRWTTLISEARSVIFYYENWWSIGNLVDYYAADTSVASPFRHFWSLSVQGQIYLLWPLIFLLAAFLIKYLALKTRVTLLLIFGLIFGASLAYSIYATAADQQTAYFNTFCRLWEFALGSLVAISLPWLNLNRYLRALMGWAGIVMIISCGFIFDVEGLFPGYHALWPTLAASMIIAAGDTQTRFGPEKLLTIKPLIQLGNFSYALYLVHWPLLVFYLHRNNTEKAGLVSGIGLLAISMVIAYFVTRWVEAPLRSWNALDRNNWRGLGVICLCMLLVLGPAYGWKTKIDRDIALAQAQAPYNNPGARSLAAGFVYRGAENPEKLPAGPMRTNDWADMGPLCSTTNPDWSLNQMQAETCHHLVQAENPSKKVMAVGNSHMHMWFPALSALAKQENWDLVVMAKGACFFGGNGDNDGVDDASCDEYAQSMDDLIKDLDPDLVFVTGTLSAYGGPDATLAGMDTRIRELTDEGRIVLGIRDTPRMEESHAKCEERTGSEADCTFPSGENVYEDPQQDYLKYPGFGAINMSDLVCPENMCPASIGNIYTYFDNHHITATYAETASDFFIERALQALDQAEASKAEKE